TVSFPTPCIWTTSTAYATLEPEENDAGWDGGCGNIPRGNARQGAVGVPTNVSGCYALRRFRLESDFFFRLILGYRCDELRHGGTHARGIPGVSGTANNACFRRV